MKLQNLQMWKVCDFGTSECEACFGASGQSKPTDCLLKITAYWIFVDENDRDHPITITLETTYFDGTSHRKALIPIRLKIAPDAGNNFADAMLVNEGTYLAYVDEVHDPKDFYSITVPSNKAIRVDMTPHGNADFDLYLYDSSEDEVCHSTGRGNVTESITYTTYYEAVWYVEVRQRSWRGIYNLTIDIYD